MRIKITIGKLVVFATLNESKTAKFIWDNLPLEAKGELWGDEIYSYISPKMGLEKAFAKTVVQVGDVAYWPEGPCLCLFFGMTPASRDGQIKPASAVNVFGKVEGDPLVLRQAKEGDVLKVEKA